MQDTYQWCNISEGGYPVVSKAAGHRFGAATAATPTMQLGIRPMKLMSVPDDTGPRAPGSKPLPFTSKLKPAPSVPAAPPELSDEFEFCVHQSDDGTRFLRFRDPAHRNHGMDVTETTECVVDADGNTVCRGHDWIVPVCHQPEADKEGLPRDCCFDIETSTLVCPGSAYDGLIVSYIEGSEHELQGVAQVSIAHPDLPGGGARVPVCIPVTGEPPPPGATAPECCVNLATSTLENCDDPSLNGTPVEIKSEPGKHGVEVFVPSMNWKGYLPVCARVILDLIPGQPPRPIPTPPSGQEPECCVDLTTSTLENCTNPELNGTPVEIKGEPGPEGVPVFVPSVNWKGYLPVCAQIVVTPPPPRTPPPVVDPPTTVPDLCCYDPATSSLVCEGTSFHGLVVELVTMAELPNGTKIASVQHDMLPGGGARLVICESTPPLIEIPPDIPEIPPREIPPPPDIPEPPRPTPEKPPQLEPIPKLPPPSPGLPEHCCYSYTSGSLECVGTEMNGLKVRLISEGAVKDGWPMVKVEHPHLPGGYAVVPVCVTDCGAGQRQVYDRSEHAKAKAKPKGPDNLERWTQAALALAHAGSNECSGRRFAAVHGQLSHALGDGCIGGPGISDRNKEYAPLPGLRGWQKGFEG